MGLAAAVWTTPGAALQLCDSPQMAVSLVPQLFPLAACLRHLLPLGGCHFGHHLGQLPPFLALVCAPSYRVPGFWHHCGVIETRQVHRLLFRAILIHSAAAALGWHLHIHHTTIHNWLPLCPTPNSPSFNMAGMMTDAVQVHPHGTTNHASLQ